MKWLLQLASFLIIPGFIFGQPFSFPQVSNLIKSAKDALSPKWALKDSAIGDLNGDHWPDMVLVLEYADTVTEFREDSTENTGKPRILLVLFWDSVAQSYDVAVQNNTFILREGEGGMVSDPYARITIRNRVLKIDYQFTRSSLSYKFRFRSPAIYLIGASDAGQTGKYFESWDFNFLTGWAEHEWTEDVSSDKARDHSERKRIKVQAPVKLKNMKFAYELEIFPSVYI